MATVKRFEDLEIWKLARELCKVIYSFTLKELFYKEYSLKNQINSASGSVMDNIAEGFGRASKNEFITFLGFSSGSVCEVKSQLYRASDRLYITEEEFNKAYKIADDIEKKNGSLITYLNKTIIKGVKFKNRQTSK
jgi:four helix bundle protein